MRQKRRKGQSSKKRKGIYILPNLFTTISLFFGFFSIISTLNGKYENAAIAILISCVFDILDGRIARLTHTTSQFGMEYDSLSDLVAFGVAPGLLVFKWSLQAIGRLGWLACFMYLACGALRLARFNIHVRNGKEVSYFKGLPIPAAASFIACIILFTDIINYKWSPMEILVAIYMLSFLMVSNINYISFKEDELVYKKPFNLLVVAILMLVLIAYKPKIVLSFLAILYVLSGPALALYNIVCRKRKVKNMQKDQLPMVKYEDNRGR